MENLNLGKKINILAKKMKWGFDITVEKHGITGVQARVLHFIVKSQKNNEVFQKDIEEEFKLRRSTVTGIVQLMEEKKLIIRTVSKDDARAKKIKLTDKGINLQKIIFNDINNYEKLLINGIEEKEIKILLETCEKIYRNIEDFERKICI